MEATGVEPTSDDVLARYGEVMLAVQQFEESLVGLLGVRRELTVMQRASELTTEDIEELESLWGDCFGVPGSSSSGS